MAELDLADIRQRIDSLDAHIQSLIAERAGLAQAVRAAKGEAASPAEYYRPDREAQVLRNVIARNDGPLADSVMLRLFREIMSACLAQQEPLRVAYLGPEGTFTQQAVFKQRSEEHTSELQSRGHLVCRLMLEKKKQNT